MAVKGRINKITNTNKKVSEVETYIRIWVEDPDGKNERPLFLTEKEFEKITKRTEKNKEDWGERGWLRDLLD